MTSIKTKSRKTFQGSSTTTLDRSHSKKITDIENKKKLLPKKKQQLKKLETKLKNYEKKNVAMISDDDVNSRATLVYDIEKLADEIKELELNNEQTEYYWKTNEYLCQYYDLENKSAGDNSMVRQRKTNTNTLTKLNEQRQQNLPKKPSTRKVKINNSASKNIMSFFNKNDVVTVKKNSNEVHTVKNNVIDKAKINDEYNQTIDPKYRNKHKKNETSKIHCDKEMRLNNSCGMYICQNTECAFVIPVIIDSDKPSHKEHTPEPSGYPYKRINHFNEHLAQIQAKETTDIPQQVYNDIRNQMIVQRKKPEDLTRTKLRSILKKLGYSRYYEHIPYMIFKINGKTPPVMTREMEENLRKYFKMTIKPFEMFKPPGRANYLKYFYALYKLCQLLEYDDFLPFCHLLKSKEKLRQQDALWKKICDYLEWEFYPSEI